MAALLIIAAAAVVGIAAWAVRRHLAAARTAASCHVEAATTEESLTAAAQTHAGYGKFIHAEGVALASDRAARRLWHLAFASPHQVLAADAVNRRVRDNVVAVLQVDTLDPKLFPRRPALMPQLLQTMNDPAAASEKLSRIVAHDPVLAADVLRLANSSLYRLSPTPIETIQRAIVICGVDGLRGMAAAAMLRPAFRATGKNFPRLPRLLWERTERATRAAERYAMQVSPQDRFEAQLVVLLSALGPLVVYGAVLDVYSRNPHFKPSGPLCVELIGELASRTSRLIARDWQSSSRLLAALDDAPGESLTVVRHVGELIGTLALLESQTVISRDERLEALTDAGIPPEAAEGWWAGLTSSI